MLFVKIGSRWLNITHVTDVVDENPDLVKVRMIAPLTGPISFRGEEAQAVREFFAAGTGDDFDVLDITPEASLEAYP